MRGDNNYHIMPTVHHHVPTRVILTRAYTHFSYPLPCYPIIPYHHSRAYIHGHQTHLKLTITLVIMHPSSHLMLAIPIPFFLYRIPTYTFLPLLYHMQTTFHAIHHPFLSHHFPSTCKILTMPTLLSPCHGIPHHHAHSPTPS